MTEIVLWLTTTLAAVPATFWGVFAGSIFSLSGVALSNRASERRQKSQFLHEFALKKEEREVAMRRDIYLAAMDALQEGSLALSRLANLEVPTAELTKDFLAKASAIGKVQIVGHEASISRIAEASTFLMAAFTRLMGSRIPLDIARASLLLTKGMVAGFEKERDRWLEQIKQYNLAAAANDQLWSTLQGNFTFDMIV